MIVWDEEAQSDFVLRETDELRSDRAAVYDEKCAHDWREIRRRVSSSGRVSFWAQCMVCGSCYGNAIARANVPDADNVPDFDPDLHKQWYAERQERLDGVNQKHIRLQKAEKAGWWRWYDQYLKSTAWRLRRDAVMTRAGGVCEGCRTRPAAQVHHLTYDNVGNEFLWELVAVCMPCHERLHQAEDGGQAA
jgi:5-methylcytosine-specific restriction endonuclease McrA